MIDKAEFIRILEGVAPPYLAADWDNSGLQVETTATDIERVLIVLELTQDVISEAKLGKYDFIIVHHPMFFMESIHGRNIVQSDVAGRYVFRLLADPPVPTAVYAAHTSFDGVEGGLCDELRSLIGLIPWDDRMHPDILKEFSHISPYARIGRFPKPTDLPGAFNIVKEALGGGTDLRVLGNTTDHVLKIMTVCGGGGDAIPLAVKTGCSLLITGDIRHHEWRLAEAEGLALIDAGHYYTERPFATLMKKRLEEALGDARKNIVIEVSANIKQPYAAPLR